MSVLLAIDIVAAVGLVILLTALAIDMGRIVNRACGGIETKKRDRTDG